MRSGLGQARALIARLHSAQRKIPPDISHSRRPALAGLRLSFRLSLAVSTHWRGMPGPGTGTPILSSGARSFTLYLYL